MKRIVILGAGESGAGAAVLAKKEGFDVFVSDMSKINDKYKKLMDDHQICWEEGHHTEEKILDADEIIKQLGLPLFVKPTCNGSSVGVTKVKTAEELGPAIYTARAAGRQIMCEKFVDGREFGCGAMEYKGKMMVFPITEICSKNEFFDYEAKYTAGKCDEVTPAQVDEDTEIEIKATTAMLYEKLECKGFVRMDYIVSDEGVFFIEANIVPGMSEASIIPKQAQCFGLTLSQLFEMAIENVL